MIPTATVFGTAGRCLGLSHGASTRPGRSSSAPSTSRCRCGARTRRHKDIFIEVDFRRLTLSDNQNGVAEHMTPTVARQMAGIYADAATTDAALRAQHAQDAGNPDGQPGVSLHLDTGVAPETPADLTVFGDWGGYSAVDAVNDGMGDYNPQTPGEAMVEQLQSRAARAVPLRARLHVGGRCVRRRHRVRLQHGRCRELLTRVRPHRVSRPQRPGRDARAELQAELPEPDELRVHRQRLPDVLRRARAAAAQQPLASRNRPRSIRPRRRTSTR